MIFSLPKHKLERYHIDLIKTSVVGELCFTLQGALLDHLQSRKAPHVTTLMKKTLIAGATALALAAGLSTVPSTADARGFGGGGHFGGGHFGGGRFGGGYGRGFYGRGYGYGYGYGLAGLAFAGAYAACGPYGYGGYYGGCGYGRPYGYGYGRPYGAYGYGY